MPIMLALPTTTGHDKQGKTKVLLYTFKRQKAHYQDCSLSEEYSFNLVSHIHKVGQHIETDFKKNCQSNRGLDTPNL